MIKGGVGDRVTTSYVSDSVLSFCIWYYVLVFFNLEAEADELAAGFL